MFCVVFPQNSAPWWSEWDDSVRMGVPVAPATHHHDQNPWGKAGWDRLCGPASQKQQYTVSITDFLFLQTVNSYKSGFFDLHIPVQNFGVSIFLLYSAGTQ